MPNTNPLTQALLHTHFQLHRERFSDAFLHYKEKEKISRLKTLHPGTSSGKILNNHPTVNESHILEKSRDRDKSVIK